MLKLQTVYLAVAVSLSTLAGCSLNRCVVPPRTLEQVATIRGLEIKEPVDCVRASPVSLKTRLMNIVRHKSPPQKIKYEGHAFKLLGYFPMHFEYPEMLIRLYSEQLIALYDPIKDQMVFSESKSGSDIATVLAHELTHALQDRYFDVENFLNYSLENDAIATRSAVLEGEATIVMRYYLGERPCHVISEDEFWGALRNASDSGGLKNIPKSVQVSMIFPYLAGERMVCDRLTRDGWAGVAKFYSDPPLSTSEVLSLGKGGKYITDLPRQSAGEPLYSDVVGQFGIAAVLANTSEIDQVRRVVEPVVGDRLWLSKQSGGFVLEWAIKFKSADKAAEGKVKLEHNFSLQPDMRTGRKVFQIETQDDIVRLLISSKSL